MFLIFLLIISLFSILLIMRNDNEKFITGFSLFVVIVSISLSILLVNLAVFVGLGNDTTFLSIFSFSVGSIFNIVKVLISIALIAMVVYFASKAE
jgi:hypothetical protein